jgi:predicted RNA-binding protein YlqC (UPF0109 family)
MTTPLNEKQADNGSHSMKEVVETIARALVDRPDAVSVAQISGAHSVIFELSVAKEDIGKIIGKQGRTAGAIRTIVNAVSAKTKMHSVLEILD